MDPKNIIHASSRDELRQWYIANHGTCQEMWLRVNRGKALAEGTIGYVDSVMEALCFGWIDFLLEIRVNIEWHDEQCPFGQLELRGSLQQRQPFFF